MSIEPKQSGLLEGRDRMAYAKAGMLLIVAMLILGACLSSQPAASPTVPSPPTAVIALAPSATAAPSATVRPSVAPTARPSPTTTASTSASVPPGTDIPAFKEPSAVGALDAATVEADVYVRFNQLRANNGLPPLAYNLTLAATARGHSCEMATQHFISHLAADGRTLTQRLPPDGPAWEWPSENIAAGFPDAAAVVDAWFNEVPPDDWHRRNILATDQREVGIGYCYADDPASGNDHYYTADFARRTDVYPLVLANGATRTSQRSVPYWLYGQGWADSMRLGFQPDLDAASWLPFAPSGACIFDGPPGPQTMYVELQGANKTTLISATILLEP